MSFYKIINIVLLLLLSVFSISCNYNKAFQDGQKKIIGWNILSSNEINALKVIHAAAQYNVNHLQLSHEIIHDLKDIKEVEKLTLVNKLITEAHSNGISEVVLWDHALYDLEYYPDQFKISGGQKLDLDNPDFWKWLKNDYRSMLDLVPGSDGIVLTFIETGARIENQFSLRLKSPEEKLAALVDSLASVIIDERKLKLYIRDFSYNKDELESLLKCFTLINNQKIIVMSKEVPHDFFITHPISWWIKEIKFPVIIEFDCAHEFNGQSVVASIFPEVHYKRWEYYKSLPNVIGFSIRTDRYGTTSIINRPSEINLFAIHSLIDDPDVGMESIYDSFIIRNYGEKVLLPVKKVFKNAQEIISSTYYTLGLNTANHSSLNFDYRSIYTRHVSGRWMENPNVSINHGVNKEFQYWIDIVNHLSPASHKTANEKNLAEIKEVIENNWIQPIELMNEEYLSYIITEKEYACRLSAETLNILTNAKIDFKDSASYEDLYNTYERTEITSRLFCGLAKTYYGMRIFNRGEKFITPKLIKSIENGLQEIIRAVYDIKNYKKAYPVGQYDWKKDADAAMKFYENMSNNEFKKYLSNVRQHEQ